MCLVGLQSAPPLLQHDTDPDQTSLNNMADVTHLVRIEPYRCCLHLSTGGLQRGGAGRTNLCFLRDTSAHTLVPLSPSTDLSSHLQSVLYFKGGFFKHRDICIEMFYSELLLIECSEAEPGEGAGKLLQRHGTDRSGVWR